MALAVHRGAGLTVLTAVDPLLAEAAKARAGMDLGEAQVEPELREFVASVVPEHASWAPEISFDMRVGNPPDVILEVAGGQNPDVVVMGTQGLGGLRKWLLGSTTERVLRHTRAPVLAVPPSATDAVVIHPDGARLGLIRILVATDFSDASDAALQWGLNAARELSLPLILAHVVQPLSVPPKWQPYVVEPDEERIARARAKLVSLSQRCGTQTCEVVVSKGAPPDAIASIAEEHRAGLIVVGLASDLGPLAPRPGSIAYQILTRSNIPVLVVPISPPERAS